MLSEEMQDLIQTYKITSTSAGLYPKQETFAYYIFASPYIGVNSFEVLPHEVSDHSLLFLDFTLGL